MVCTSGTMMEDMNKFCHEGGLGLTYSAENLGVDVRVNSAKNGDDETHQRFQDAIPVRARQFSDDDKCGAPHAIALSPGARFKIWAQTANTACKRRPASMPLFSELKEMGVEHVPATHSVLIWGKKLLDPHQKRRRDGKSREVHNGEENQLEGLQRTRKLCKTASWKIQG